MTWSDLVSRAALERFAWDRLAGVVEPDGYIYPMTWEQMWRAFYPA